MRTFQVSVVFIYNFQLSDVSDQSRNWMYEHRLLSQRAQQLSAVPFVLRGKHDPQWGARYTESKPHMLRTQGLKVLRLKPAVGRYIATHATITARDFFLANFYPSGPFTCIFPKPFTSFFSFLFFSVLAVANTGSCLGPHGKICHPVRRYRQLMPVPC